MISVSLIQRAEFLINVKAVRKISERKIVSSLAMSVSRWHSAYVVGVKLARIYS